MNAKLSEQIRCIMRQELQSKGYVTPIEVLTELHILTPDDIAHWRGGRIPYLEKICKADLTELSKILREMSWYAGACRFTPSWTCYKTIGTEEKKTLHFTKNDIHSLEQEYATHFLDVKRLRELKNAARAT